MQTTAIFSVVASSLFVFGCRTTSPDSSHEASFGRPAVGIIASCADGLGGKMQIERYLNPYVDDGKYQTKVILQNQQAVSQFLDAGVISNETNASRIPPGSLVVIGIAETRRGGDPERGYREGQTSFFVTNPQDGSKHSGLFSYVKKGSGIQVFGSANVNNESGKSTDWYYGNCQFNGY